MTDSGVYGVYPAAERWTGGCRTQWLRYEILVLEAEVRAVAGGSRVSSDGRWEMRRADGRGQCISVWGVGY